MTDLIALLSTGKGTWKSVFDLMDTGEWGQVLLIGPEFARDKVGRPNAIFVSIDPAKPLENIAGDIAKVLREAVKDMEVALNLESGTGKEHMAVISGIMQAGLGFRLVESDGGKIRVLGNP